MSGLLLGVGLMIVGAVLAVAARSRSSADVLFAVPVLAGALTAGLAAARALTSGDVSRISIHSAVPGGAWDFALDPLSALFVVAICIVGAACVLFGAPYLAAERAHRPVWFSHAAFAVVLAALVMVVSAQAVVPFLIAWEVMAVGSYFLIVHESERAEVRRAGLIYLVATHTGMLCIIAMFALWSGGSGDWTFAALERASPLLPHGGALVLTLALIGFGFKAGFFPLHFWLPPAHAAAPSHVSALMSGIVIKMGIYGVLRVVSLLDGAPPAWWGWAVLAAGSVSAVLGVLWALAQHDMKRLLAYHSVENIGIILMGAGVGALGAAYGHPVVAMLGFAGAALHTLNHALFKSLLFLGAGAVQRATGTRDLEALGGVGKRMPRTWMAFIIGAAAIVGLPPLNGFVSEWLVYLGLFDAARSAGTAGGAASVSPAGATLLRFAALGIPALALVGGLALACFAKVSGAVFLGTPRTAAGAGAREVSGALHVPMFGLAAACVALGVVPALGVAPALKAAAVILPRSLDVAPGAALAIGALGTVRMLAVLLVLLAGLAWFVRQALLRRRSVRTAATWGCAYGEATARMQYTASSFAAPLLGTFGGMSSVMTHRTGERFFTEPVDPVLDRAAAPVWHRVRLLALRLRPMQQGRLSAYLLYVMVALVVLLAYLSLGMRR